MRTGGKEAKSAPTLSVTVKSLNFPFSKVKNNFGVLFRVVTCLYLFLKYSRCSTKNRLKGMKLERPLRRLVKLYRRKMLVTPTKVIPRKRQGQM